MGDGVVTEVSQITTEWLESVLQRAGALRGGGVLGFDVETRTESWSNSARLHLRYLPDSSGDLPASLFLKMCRFTEFGGSEVDYYRRDYVGAADVPIVRSYDARYDSQQRAYHLLLDDLSASHTNTWQSTVTPELVAAIARAVAALHAHRWDAAAIHEIGAHLPGKPELDGYFDHIRRGLEPLLAIGGDDVKPEWRPLLHEIFEHHPNLMLARTRQPRGICLVHGDVNPGNVLAPRTWPGRVYLIDRQPFDWSLRVWLGVSDLAYLLCSFWPVEIRRDFEQIMLEHYHSALVRLGIEDYGWHALWADYRLSAVQAVYVAVEWCVLESDRARMRWLWTRELRQAICAFEDLRCRELWTG